LSKVQRRIVELEKEVGVAGELGAFDLLLVRWCEQNFNATETLFSLSRLSSIMTQCWRLLKSE
jgi:hypothetical protein